jgi:hypothetical protein
VVVAAAIPPAVTASPDQYGFVGTKHLCSIELDTAEPTKNVGAGHRISHPRARVWQEETSPLPLSTPTRPHSH